MRASHTVAAGSLLFSAAAQAAFTTYVNRAAFLGRLSADGVTPATEGFEGIAATNSFTTTLLTAPRVTVSSSPQMGVWDTPFQGAHASEGSHFVAVGTSPAKFMFAFDVPRTHFGFSVIDYGDAGSGVLRASFAGGNPMIVDTTRPDGEEVFFGIVSDLPLLNVQIICTNSGDSFAVDGLIMGTVPAPGAWGAAAIGAAWLARRRR